MKLIQRKAQWLELDREMGVRVGEGGVGGDGGGGDEGGDWGEGDGVGTIFGTILSIQINDTTFAPILLPPNPNLQQLRDFRRGGNRIGIVEAPDVGNTWETSMA